MAGTLKVDNLNADSNLALKIANTAVAFIDSNGLRPVSGNLNLDATGTTGVGSPAANTLVLYTAGTEDVRVTSAGDVGIGTSSPEAKFHISGTGDLYAKVESTGSQAGIKFETTTAGTSEYGILADSSEALRFYDFKNGSEPVRFNRYGIGLGGTTPSSGIGIAFPSTQSASSNANTLDDYEEGTWTPIAASQGGSITSYSSNGSYVKIGKTVFVRAEITITNVGTASGRIDGGGLPFIERGERPFVALARENAVTGNSFIAYGANAATTFQITALTDVGAVTWTNGYSYVFTATYLTD
jgi:hypothetical protein